ncbi:myosin phosphatase Rho-interacting protein isoform X1, partial [Silurus meridionalis]
MSTAKENPCRKFQANIFNKSKCQNCFKPRELHLLTDPDLNQAKPIYGGWLCLAPEGTDFDNPMQRSRKWQRRFFVLYEHGCLRFALDESPSTLPQGTVNMNLCTDVIDAEPKTGQKNALCIITPEQEYYIRGDNKELINGWSEQLVVYPRTNKQNQKKKRKVEPTTSQEPGPAKVAVTGSGIPEAEKVPDSSSIIWQEELQSREAEVSQAWSSPDMTPQGSLLTPAVLFMSHVLSSAEEADLGSVNGDEVDRSAFSFSPCMSQPPQDLVSPTAGLLVHVQWIPHDFTNVLPVVCVLSGRSNVIEKLKALDLENAERMEVEETARSEARQGRSEMRRFNRQPDLLNFKKGWMVKLDEQGQWKKYWFVLTDHSLRYYKDSIAEEASDLDGEIDLSTCSNVTEYQAQRNYGFQIHTQEGVHTLSAMTAGIRRNWIQAVMKNVRPSTAPDVASLTDEHGSFSALESLTRPDVTQDSASSEASSAEREPRKSRARERRREGRSKTFDWAEFRPIAQALAQQRAHEADAFQAQLSDAERSKRREERRRRYECVTGSLTFEPSPDASGIDSESVHAIAGSDCPPSPEHQQKVEEEIEQRWQQVEKTPIREERRIPLSTALRSRETSELEKLLESYKKGVCLHVLQVEDLKTQLETCHQQLVDSNQHKQELENQLKAALDREHQIRAGYISPKKKMIRNHLCYIFLTNCLVPFSKLESPLSLETKPQTKKPELVSSQAQSLTKKYQETKELLQLQELKKRNMQAQLGLSLSHLCTQDPSLPDTKTSSTSELLPSSLVTKSVTFVLVDNDGKIGELKDLMDFDKPLSVKELIKLLHCYTEAAQPDFPQDTTETDRTGNLTKCQKLLQSLKNHQEMENETMRKSLAKAGDSIRDYEARLITMEDMLGRVQKPPYLSPCQQEDSAQTSQRVELLTSENEALNQRYQEIVNQLREADREIDRLKAELQRHQSGTPCRQSGVAQEEGFTSLYEQELLDKSRKLEEALVKLEVLGNSLKDTEKKLQLKEATLKGLGFQVVENEKSDGAFESDKERLQNHIDVIECKLSEKEKALQFVEQDCKELRAQNIVLQMKSQEAEESFNRAHLEEENVQKLKERDVEEIQTDNECRADSKLQSDDVIEDVLEGFKRRSNALDQVLAMLMKSSDEWSVCFEEGNGGRNLTESTMASFEREILVERMLLENEMLFSISRNVQSGAEHVEMQTDKDVGDKKFNGVVMKQLVETVQSKITMLNEIALTVEEPLDEQFKSLALTLSNCEPQTQWSRCLQDAILDVTHTYLLIHQRFQTENKTRFDNEAACACCYKLQEQNLELQLRLDQMSTQTSSPPNPDDSKPATSIFIEGEPIDSLDKAIQLQDMVAKHKKELRDLREAYELEASKLKEEVSKSEETLRLRSEENIREIDSLTICMENLKKKHEMERTLLAERFNQELSELNELLGSLGADHPDDTQLSAASLKQRIRELVAQETKRRDREEDATSLRLKYEKDLENLKVVMFLVFTVLFIFFPILFCFTSFLMLLATIMPLSVKHLSFYVILRIEYLGKSKCKISKPRVCMSLLTPLSVSRQKRRNSEGVLMKTHLPIDILSLFAHASLFVRSPDAAGVTVYAFEVVSCFPLKDEKLSGNRFSVTFIKPKLVVTVRMYVTCTKSLSGFYVLSVFSEEYMFLWKPFLYLLCVLVKGIPVTKPRKIQCAKRCPLLHFSLSTVQDTCERGFAAMEESHQKVIDKLQRKHQRELENLQEEKERLLAEETAATIAAIEAMKNAHRTELEKELDKARKANNNSENADIEEIRRQHEEELLSFQREIEVLSEQYSQKCLENAHLAQALEAERQALRQCQRENQELNAHNQELNNRLAAEITKMRSMTSEEAESGTVIQGKELYELEVMLRVKESEVQYLKQEINSLKDELQAAQRDKKYSTDKYKDIYTELSIVKAKAERDLGRLREQLQLAHEALGEPTPEEVQRGGYDIMKSKSNPDILKMAAAAAKRSERTMRSK